MPSSNPLPPKENALFKRILKCYEHKQYKNGLKFAKQILSNPKYSEHGETLAMKGLTLNCLGRKEEAYEYVRRGLRNDLKSHVCWHVYGLLQRSDKKYDEAIKCYRNALKWDKDNIQILKDIALLQIQMRDLEGYKDTRYQLLHLRPTQRVSWIGFAISYHLLKEFETAFSILISFSNNQPKESEYEYSELLLYQNLIIQESGKLEYALMHLEKYEANIIDKLAVSETYGDLYLKLKQYDQAVVTYTQLIKRNPENTLYYHKLIEAEQLTKRDDQIKLFMDHQKLYPRAIPPRRLILNLATGDQFREFVDAYLRKGLHKGVPPLFVDMRSLYSDKDKVRVIESLCLQYVECLKESGTFAKDAGKGKEPASALLWTYYYLAQHYDYLGQTDNAIMYIDLAIEHTPTLIELFVTKGRIYKHAGNVKEAYIWLDEAQSLDTADRYINSKCAKYMLRANMIKEAEETCAKFTREGVSAMENLNEMQCMWFQTECAQAYQRLEKYGDALKKCHEIDRHFSEIIDDQFDFHTYCMRKMTLRSYVGLLRLEDVLRGHPFYFRAAKCAIEVYLRLHDKPLKDEVSEEELITENLPPNELKKLRNKQRKARRKAELESKQAAQALVKREQHNKSRQTQDAEPDAPQLDELIPEKLARVDDPLDQAIRFLTPLKTLSANNLETHLMAFEIYYRKEKILLMLQSIKRAFRIAPDHPKLHSCIIRFHEYVSSVKETTAPAITEVITKEVQIVFNGKSAVELNKIYLESHQDCLYSTLEGARMLYFLNPSNQEKAIQLITAFKDNLKNINLKTCTNIYESLRNGDFGQCPQVIEEFKNKCHGLFPHASLFQESPTITAAATAVISAITTSKCAVESTQHESSNNQNITTN